VVSASILIKVIVIVCDIDKYKIHHQATG
jgi:hypothetical protein